MVFSELYGAYYNAVAKILQNAVKGGVTAAQRREIIESIAFSESVLAIEPVLRECRWQLMNSDGSTPLRHIPTMPLTELQRRWLRSISLDPRIKLFECDFSYLEGTEPLFTPDDYYIFDSYSDGDDYSSEEYRTNFRIILNAVSERRPLKIDMVNRRNEVVTTVLMPDHIEYSEKDDKFRLIGHSRDHYSTINLGRITSCRADDTPINDFPKKAAASRGRVAMILTNERNTLERAMLHFSHFKKETVRIDDKHYKLTVEYDKNDQTELVIRILSFGPTVRVIEPESFVRLIKQRLINQEHL